MKLMKLVKAAVRAAIAIPAVVAVVAVVAVALGLWPGAKAMGEELTGDELAPPTPSYEKTSLAQNLGAQVPLELRFRDESGKDVALGDYFGNRPVILALAYYGCPNLCSLVLDGLLETTQQLRFSAGTDYHVVVVSIAPNETPADAAAKKKGYIRRYGRDGAEKGWHFLTGSAASIGRLAESVGYKFAWDDASQQYAHPSTIIILTPKGRVARYFPGIEFPAKETRLALVEASDNKIGSISDHVYLLCFHYDPHTGRYGLVIWRVMQLAGCGTALLLFGYVGHLFRREP